MYVFVSDQHKGIAKWIKETQPKTRHFFDIWHIARSIHKKLLNASKKKVFLRIKYCLKGVRSHLTGVLLPLYKDLKSLYWQNGSHS